jgi:DNA-directed RNA polymerase subunit RPC12/RpoP
MTDQMQTLQRHDEDVHQDAPNALAQMEQPTFAMTSSGLKPRSIEEAWRFATCLASSQFVPATYQGKPHDCLIAIDMASRLNVAPLMLLQNTYVVNGKPGMEAKLVISLINASGLFTDPLDYEVEGDDPKDKKYRVRAFATRTKTGKAIYGPWITWAIVTGEGWDTKKGSKWQTIPSLMFIYRAAAWFSRQHCPEVAMGMLTTDELHDIEERKEVDAKVLDGKPRGKFGFNQKDGSDQTQPAEETTDPVDQPTEDAVTEPETAPGHDDGVDDPAPDGAPDEAPQDTTPEQPSPPEDDDVEWLYHCNKCRANFDKPFIKDPKGARITCCPNCKSDDLAAWDDWKAKEALKDV